MILAV